MPTFKQLIKEHRSVILLIILMSVFRSSIADWNYIPSPSMRPTLVEGDRVLINKLAYDVQLPFIYKSINRHANPERGDVIVFRSKVADLRLIKRVVGIPGDSINVIGNRVVRNGVALKYELYSEDQNEFVLLEGDDTHTNRIRPGVRLHEGITALDSVRGRGFNGTVPPDHYLVLGDNRNNSADSRYYGFVPRDEIIGRARQVVFSHDPDNFYIPRRKRWIESLDPELDPG